MSKKNKVGLTRQGVKNLNSLPSRPRGIRLEMPPDMMMGICNHAATRIDNDGDVVCIKCGIIL